MRRSHYVILASLACVTIFLGLNLAAWKWLAPVRADFTANSLYTLSSSAKRVVQRLVEPVELELVYSRSVGAEFPAIRAHADRTGKKVMYAFNLTGEVDEMRSRHDLVLAEGGTCVMASVNWTGPAAITALRRHSELPIHGHRNGFGALNRAPALGFGLSPRGRRQGSAHRFPGQARCQHEEALQVAPVGPVLVGRQ